jgi:hypothetical protein
MPGCSIFGKRDKALPDTFVYDDLPATLRNQIIWILKEQLIPLVDPCEYHCSINPFAQVQQIVCQERGIFGLSNSKTHDPAVDVIECIRTSDEVVLALQVVEQSFVALVFCCEALQCPENRARDAVDLLNHRYRENGVGFEFDLHAAQLNRVDNLVTHQHAIRPTLQLLSARRFKNANKEYLEALDDFKKGDHDDCLTKCGMAFESVMKIVCDQKRWPYTQTDNAGQLLKTIIDKSGLGSFFEQPLILIATLRNRFGAHGRGTQTRHVPEHFARYALNATASAILLVVEQANACP